MSILRVAKRMLSMKSDAEAQSSIKCMVPSCHLIGLRDAKKMEAENLSSLFSYKPRIIYMEAGHEVSAAATQGGQVHHDLLHWLRHLDDLHHFASEFETETFKQINITSTAVAHNRVIEELMLSTSPLNRSRLTVSKEGQYVRCVQDPAGRDETLYGFLTARNAQSVALRGFSFQKDKITSLTFGDVIQLIHAAVDLRKVGLRAGDLVAYMVPNGIVGAVAFLTFGSQTSVAPLDPQLQLPDLIQALTQLKPACLVTFDCLSPGSREIAEAATRECDIPLVVAQLAPDQSGRFSLPPISSTEDVNAIAPLRTTAEQTLFIMRTSGTTSLPKVVPQKCRAVIRNGCRLGEDIGLRSDDVSLNAMPLFHVGGIYSNLLATLSVGGSVVCLPAFNGELFARALRPDHYPTSDAAPTWFSAVPTMHAMILESFEALRGDAATSSSAAAHRLRLIRSGAAALSDDLAQQLQQAFGCPVIPTYAMSEQMPITQCPRDYKVGEKPGSVGLPVNVSLCVVSPTLRVLPFGEEQRGEICISGDTVCEGYVDNAVANGHSYFIMSGTGEKWFRTGDVGYVDRDGYLFITGREKELIKRGGEQVSPVEVEETCMRFTYVEKYAVDVCVVFAVPCPFWGQDVGIAMVLRSRDDEKAAASIQPTDEEEKILQALQAFCLEQGLAGFKAPQYLVLLKDRTALPKTSTNKYVRIGLAEKLGVAAKSRERAVAKLSELRTAPISPAMSGVRVLLGCWIFYNHVGRRNKQGMGDWYDGRGWCSHVPAFVVLGGFMLAASSTAPMVAPGRLRHFYQTRLLGIYPMYLVSIAFAIFTFLFYCRPDTYVPSFSYGSQDLCRAPPIETNWAGSFVMTVVSYVLGLQAWPFAIPFTFFLSYYSFYNSIYYFCIALFPFFQRPLLRHTTEHDASFAWRFVGVATLGQALFEILHGMYWPIRAANDKAAGFFSLFMYLFPPFWLPLFCIGMGSYFLFAHYRPFARADRWKWGVVTDLCSLLYLTGVLLWIEDTEAVYPNAVDSPQDVRYWASFVSRLISPMTCLWIFGLAVGEGYSAKLLSHPIFSEILGPPFYCVYLFHQMISQWYFYFTRDGEWAAVPKPFYWFSPVAVPIGVGEFFGLLAIVFVICYVMERYFHPVLVAQTTNNSSEASLLKLISVATESIKLSMALLAMPNSTSNATKPSYVLSLPDSLSKISVTLPSSNNAAGGSVTLSVVEYLASIFAGVSYKSNNNSTSSLTQETQKLVSSVITIQVISTSKNGTKSSTTLPQFEANLQLDPSATGNGTAGSGTKSSVLRHNCTVGEVEHISMLCPGSNIRLNLTCSGKSSIVIKRQCPVLQTVCSIVNLADNTVVSNDYCRAVEMGSSILCRCGYDSTGSNTNLTDVLLALGGKVSVGAFRSYAAGGLESSVDILSATSIAQKSIMIIACFVSVWGVGIVFLTLSVPNLRLRRNQKLKKVRALKHRNDTVPPASPLTDDTSSTPLPLLLPPEADGGATKAPVEALPVEAYLLSSLPVFFTHSSRSVMKRVLIILSTGHKYGRVAQYLFS
eukprot:gene12249-8762_t